MNLRRRTKEQETRRAAYISELEAAAREVVEAWRHHGGAETAFYVRPQVEQLRSVLERPR